MLYANSNTELLCKDSNDGHRLNLFHFSNSLSLGHYIVSTATKPNPKSKQTHTYLIYWDDLKEPNFLNLIYQNKLNEPNSVNLN